MIETREYTLPIYWGTYLIYGDSSGLNEGEQEYIDDWMQEEQELEGYKVFRCTDQGEDYWFASRNDASHLGGDVTKYTFIVKE